MRTVILVACLWAATSPLHAKIASDSNRDGNHEIYTMDSDGSNQTRLTFNDAPDIWPAWSPNGQQIVFQRNRDGNGEIYVVDTNGQNQRRLKNHPALDAYPHWAPDGKQIAFTSGRDANEEEPRLEIYTMDTDGRNVRRVTDMGFVQRPRWSPSGEWILFMEIEIFAIRPEGKQVLYTEAVNLDPNQSFPVIATLDEKRPRTVLRWKHVPVPRMAFDTASFGADDIEGDWHIYHFELNTNKLIQLTNSPGTAEMESGVVCSTSTGGVATTLREIKAEG